MDRDRVAAWVASLGGHPHGPVLRDLLDAYDRAAAETAVWRGRAAAAGDELRRAQSLLADCEEDCARLAGHIVAHPAGDYHSVLTLHDRRTR